MVDDVDVLHCYRTFFPETQGGLEQAILEICINTPSAKVLTLSNKPGHYTLRDDRVPVDACKRWFSIASCCVGGGLLRLLRRDKADVLHFHFPWPFGDVAYLLAGRGRPLVVTYHSDVVRQRFLGALYRPLMRRFLAKADRIVATSTNYVETSEVLQEFRDKVDVIPLGVSEENYPAVTQEAIDSMESRYGRDFMLFVGVLRYYKGLEFLIRAAAGQPYQLVIAGKGPEFVRLKELAHEVGADNVSFAGFVSDVEKMALMQLCRAVVFPSHLRSEAFGVTLVEGLMSAKPLISCDIGTGTSFVNVDGKTGLVVPPADSGALRSAMLELWRNPERARSLGAAARRRFETLFTAEKMASAYASLYRKILADRKGRGVVTQ